MDITIGDALAVIGIVMGVCISAWALLVGVALLFEEKAMRARAYAEAAPKKALGLGVVLALLIGSPALILLQQPSGVRGLLGYALFLGLLSISVVGGGGLARLIAERIKRLETRLSGFGALAIAASLLILPGLFPLLGWFVFAPLVALTSLGAGFHALIYREKTAAQPVAPPSSRMEPVA